MSLWTENRSTKKWIGGGSIWFQNPKSTYVVWVRPPLGVKEGHFPIQERLLVNLNFLSRGGLQFHPTKREVTKEHPLQHSSVSRHVLGHSSIPHSHVRHMEGGT